MIDIQSKYDNIYNNGIFYVLICINNNVNSCINFMLSTLPFTYFYTLFISKNSSISLLHVNSYEILIHLQKKERNTKRKRKERKKERAKKEGEKERRKRGIIRKWKKLKMELYCIELNLVQLDITMSSVL